MILYIDFFHSIQFGKILISNQIQTNFKPAPFWLGNPVMSLVGFIFAPVGPAFHARLKTAAIITSVDHMPSVWNSVKKVVGPHAMNLKSQT